MIGPIDPGSPIVAAAMQAHQAAFYREGRFIGNLDGEEYADVERAAMAAALNAALAEFRKGQGASGLFSALLPVSLPIGAPTRVTAEDHRCSSLGPDFTGDLQCRECGATYPEPVDAPPVVPGEGGR